MNMFNMSWLPLTSSQEMSDYHKLQESDPTLWNPAGGTVSLATNYDSLRLRHLRHHHALLKLFHHLRL